VNAASYIAVLVALLVMRAGQLYPAPLVARASGQLREGFHYVWSTPILRNALLMMAIIGTLAYEFQVILPLFAQFTLRGGAGTYAALTVAMGIGSVIGGLYTASRTRVVPRMMVSAAFLFGAAILAAAIAPSLAFAMAALVLVGAFSINFLSLGNSTLQLESVPEMRGRVMALWAMAFLGSTPIGGPIIGWIGEHAGPRWGLAIGGLAALTAGALCLPGGAAERLFRTPPRRV
jgi:MFS family permease